MSRGVSASVHSGGEGGLTVVKGKFRVTAGCTEVGGRVRNLVLKQGGVILMLGGQEEGGDQVWFMG